ncbi:NADH-quinone oxidoreductase subunit NuoF [Leptolinea tardivitalis]|uniref:NADH dehydrogenase n=1 Tax=Leptolinea tardivitalis TaxID=229920 RepID=A0A0P6X1P6_9CHLR|nr:NADH-quinone oxidoreductase subunit NuoF [Leptolinea tardivitalis]KPL73329.1 NADH dehydrogenase [Leptolinea tardivitalis]GAP21463.1 NAD(P)-dependent iron-only hydrogenase diaphorase component flavoprotein [Leptolinea tardivitalis]
MPKITSYEKLLECYKEYQPLLHTRKDGAAHVDTKTVLICGGTGCQSSDSLHILAEFNRLIAEKHLEGKVEASITGCFGFCEKGPIVKVFPDNTFYVQVTPADVLEIVEQDLIKGQRVTRLLYEEPNKKEKVAASEDIPFYKLQKRVALRNCGFINPEKIEEYIANAGYQALGRALTQMTPAQVIDEVKRSGLRGRGGAGFSTGKKWEFASMYESEEKFVICNADEGDPGAFMDRSIMEGDAHSVIEGMALAGYAIGAHQGYVYIRAEYPLAVNRLKIALIQAREHGLLGEHILGTNFNFDIDIRLGAGAFVCGEETALIHSVEGGRGEPRNKPPFPAQSGLWEKPTIVNNVETLANIPILFQEGAAKFAELGSQTSKGTKVFALAGKVNNVGLVEVPMGTPLRKIIYDIGGGIRGGANFKAAQTGGPSGGCIPAQFLDTPIDYESLMSIGSMMGSGGMIVLNDHDCMVNIARFYLEFTVEESCGRCAPCRIGNKRMLEILTDITEGRGTEADLRELKELSQTITDTSLCGLGQTAPNPVISTMKYFWDEYEAHVKEKRCPAGVCQKLLKYEIDPAKCIGCTACARGCPVSCISGSAKQPHVIDQTRCIKCGACMTKCRFGAISRN